MLPGAAGRVSAGGASRSKCYGRSHTPGARVFSSRMSHRQVRVDPLVRVLKQPVLNVGAVETDYTTRCHPTSREILICEFHNVETERLY
jgi:hypothetical protein